MLLYIQEAIGLGLTPETSYPDWNFCGFLTTIQMLE